MEHKALSIWIKLARAIPDRFYRRVYLIDCHFAIGGTWTSESDAIVLHEIDLFLFQFWLLNLFWWGIFLDFERSDAILFAVCLLSMDGSTALWRRIIVWRWYDWLILVSLFLVLPSLWSHGCISSGFGCNRSIGLISWWLCTAAIFRRLTTPSICLVLLLSNCRTAFHLFKSLIQQIMKI